MAILPASLTENTNSHTANNPTNISIMSTSHSHYHQQHQRYQQQHSQQQQQQQRSRPAASPHHRKPKYYQQQQQQLSPPYSTCTRRQSISSEEDLSEFSSSSSSSLFYDEDFSSSSSTGDDDHHHNLKNTRTKSPPHSPPRSPQRRYYNNSNYYHYNPNNNITSQPRTPNANANNNNFTNNKNNNKYMHSYKKPVMPARNLYLAMDCEMIQTIRHESIAARVVLVDWKGRTVLDTYIHHPAEQVVDYKTFVSGITPQHLEDAPSFAHVQQQVLDLLQDKILVGHGLENDLKALQIMDHPWWMIRDTAHYQPFMQERVPGSGCWMPRKLRDLVQEKLPQCYDNDFQKDGTAHCPAADAKAALDLYKSHRPRWEACMIQHVKKSTAAITTSPLQQGFMMTSPCSVMMMPSHKLQQHQQSPMMSPHMAMMLPTPALALSSPMATAAVAAAAPFYSSPSPSQSHSVRSSKPVWSSSRQQQQQQQQHLHPTFTALPSLPF